MRLPDRYIITIKNRIQISGRMTPDNAAVVAARRIKNGLPLEVEVRWGKWFENKSSVYLTPKKKGK